MLYHDSTLWNNKNFPNKIKDDEDIIFLIRQDIIFILGKGILLGLVSLAFLFFRLFVVGLTDDPLLVSLFDSGYYSVNILLITIFVFIFHNYYLSLQIVTNERVIDIDQTGLFKREVNEMPLSNIEDVNYKQNGFWGTIFNYGNVILQTAGTGASNSSSHLEDKTNGFTMNGVPKPSEVCDNISKLYHSGADKDLADAAKANADALRKSLTR